MPNLKIDYGSPSSFTISLNSLAGGNSRQSTAIDNSSTKYAEALVFGQITSGTSVSANGRVYVYIFGSIDGGTSYTGGAGASDASFTTANTAGLIPIGQAVVNADSTAFKFGPISIANAVGYLPERWGIVITNGSGASFASSGHSIGWQPVSLHTA